MQAISLHTAAVLATVFTSSLSVRTNNLSTLMSRGVVAARQEIADPPSEDEVAASEAKAREIYDRAVSVARSLKTLDLVVKSNSDADSGGNPSGAARVRMEFDLAGEFAISRLRVDIAEDDPAVGFVIEQFILADGARAGGGLDDDAAGAVVEGEVIAGA